MSTRRKYFFHTVLASSRRAGGSISAPVHMKNTGTAKRASESQNALLSQLKLPMGKSSRP